MIMMIVRREAASEWSLYYIWNVTMRENQNGEKTDDPGA